MIRIEIDDHVATLSSSLSLSFFLFPLPNPLHLFFVFLFSLSLFLASSSSGVTLDAHKLPIRPAPRGLLLGLLSSHFSESYTRIRFTMRHQVYELIDDKDKRIRDRIADKTIGHDRVTMCVCKRDVFFASR